MPKYISLDELKKYRYHCDEANADTHFINGVESVIEFANAFAIEDAVPVVRCRDCKYRSKDTQWTRAGYCGRRGAGDFFVAPPDGYCSYGERKERDT